MTRIEMCKFLVRWSFKGLSQFLKVLLIEQKINNNFFFLESVSICLTLDPRLLPNRSLVAWGSQRIALGTFNF